MQDKIYDNEKLADSGLLEEDGTIGQFSFNEQVSLVFDDMISRSIPGYDYVQDLTASLVSDINPTPTDKIYDLGCSTGTSLLKIANSVKDLPKLVGLDLSSSMIKRANEKKAAYGLDDKIQFLEADIIEYPLEDCILAISHYTLQFIDPKSRAQILSKIYNSLKPGGYFLYSEKVYHEDKDFEALITKHYYDFKEKNGYSRTEIMRKRQALENFLRPNTTEGNLKALKEAGFQYVDVISKQLCFVTFVGRKEG